MTLKFNIVYTPGTVRYLGMFVHSLLKWSDASFRLVSNGCLPPERRFLRKLCDRDPRLDYWAIPTKTCMPHDQALNYLQAMTESDYFCFMDSDIFASGDFLGEVRERLTEHAGLFSGAPIWVTARDQILPEAFQIMSGLHSQAHNGACLGSTFFAVYDNAALTAWMQSAGMGFETYEWSEIPREHQERLADMGLAKESYDTGKVLNLLLLSQGHRLTYLNLPHLCHIGGTSFLPLYERAPRGLMSRMASRLTDTWLKPVLLPLLEKRRARLADQRYRRFEVLTRAEQQAIVAQRKRQRDPVREHFLALLRALFDGRPPPAAPQTGVPEIDAKTEAATREIIALYKEFEQQDV